MLRLNVQSCILVEQNNFWSNGLSTEQLILFLDINNTPSTLREYRMV